MKFVKKKEFLDGDVHTNKYYVCGIRVLKKIYSNSFSETYLFKFKISNHKYNTKITNYRSGVNFMPRVSIVVPNYNHAPFLKQRLDSIYNQTYRNYDVLLLDDCSTDNSRDILQKYANKHKDNTKCIFNNKNSGGVFFQWSKALKFASGDLIWIAESDDYCDNDFLEKMVHNFIDESVMIAFCQSDFIKNGKKIWSTQEYLNDLKYDWNNNFTETTDNLLNNGFAYKNFICNVSSCVFKNTGFESILANKDWYKLKVCGDWLFYLDLARGGRIAYNADTTNYYRQHDHNTSVSSHTKDFFFKEHEFISMYIMKNFSVNTDWFIKLSDNLQCMLKDKKLKIDKLYSVNTILKTKRENKNIMFVSYGFYTGGGETFPIYLANQLKKMGHNITFCVFNDSNGNKGIHELLNKSIPVIYKQKLSNWFDVFSDFNTDIVYSGYFGVDYDIAKSPKPLKTKHFVTMHGMYECMEDEVLKYTKRILMGTVYRWIYIADKNLIPFKEHNIKIDDRFIKVPNGLPISDISPIPRKKLEIPEKAFVMCVVSRGIPEKGWKEAIEATKILRNKTKKDVHLIICGDGEMYEILKDNQPNYIHMCGFQKNTRDYIASSDILLLPSTFKGESFPLVMIDAIFCGKPIVATNIGETKNIITVGKNMFGDIVDLENDGSLSVQKFANAIEKFITMGLPKNYSNLAKILKDRYNIEHIGQVYDKIYKK